MTLPARPPAREGYEVRRMQPYRTEKSYVCPGCGNDIPSGTGHVVAWPEDASAFRRHWHHACWRIEVRRT